MSFDGKMPNHNDSQFCKRSEYTIDFQHFASNSAYAMFGYYVFILLFIAQLGVMIWDLHKDFILRRTSRQSPIVGCWLDLINMCLCFLVIIGGQSALWLVITLILVMCLMTEVVQMTNNMTTLDLGYFLSIGNILDLGIIIMVAIVIYAVNLL